MILESNLRCTLNALSLERKICRDVYTFDDETTTTIRPRSTCHVRHRRVSTCRDRKKSEFRKITRRRSTPALNLDMQTLLRTSNINRMEPRIHAGTFGSRISACAFRLGSRISNHGRASPARSPCVGEARTGGTKPCLASCSTSDVERNSSGRSLSPTSTGR